MDPRMIEINNLRVLNDYLNQTIDVLIRNQRVGISAFGVSPTSFASTPWSTSPMSQGHYGLDSMYSPFGGSVGAHAGFSPSYTQGVDPFLAQRGMSHSPFSPVSPWSPLSEAARQTQLAHAIAVKQSVADAMYRATGIPA
jgi:hypothetical protein